MVDKETDTAAGESLGDDIYSRTIDKLRELGIADLVSLPQLVVVGDQSSGKSSVLESVTGFAFPRAPELCTRYATQITCRRDDFESIHVSIIPSQDSSDDRKERLRTFVHSVKKDDLALADVFSKANEAMGLRGVKGRSVSGSAFTEDILKIEINGPKQHHLTVIDVPGIFRTATKNLTTDDDIVLVRNMVKRYIRDQRTIILAVIPCNVDIATQEVLTLAKEVDPQGVRTMGVLTKPDLATERATQQIVCELVEGKRHQVRLGYCVVKNRSADDETFTMKDRNSSEKVFFSANPWSRLKSTKRVGINSLSARLRDLLRDVSKKEFKNVTAEVHRMLQENESELDRMGPSRSRAGSQRQFLGQIASDFQDAARRARDGHYSGMAMFDKNPSLRLVTLIVSINEEFTNTFALSGHTRNFDGLTETEGIAEGITKKPSKPGKFIELDQKLAGILREVDYNCPEPKNDSLLEDIERVFHQSRGADLGSFGGSVLAQVFKEQSKKWKPLVLQHVSRAIVIVHSFIGHVLRLKCPGDNTFEDLHDNFLLPKLRASYKRAMEHAQFLIDVELSGQPYTLNHYFNNNLQVSQANRLQQAIHKVVGPATSNISDGGTNNGPRNDIPPSTSPTSTSPAKNASDSLFNFSEQKSNESSGAVGWWIPKAMLPKLTTNRSNAEQAREDIHDVLRSYYKVARKRFVDVVVQQVIFHFLLDARDSPLKIFCPDLVMGLDDGQLRMIAGEDSATREKREHLTSVVENLRLAAEELTFGPK